MKIFTSGKMTALLAIAAAATSTTWANSMLTTPGDSTLLTETMMEAQSFNSLILYGVFGVDTSSILNYSSNTNPTAQTFSFATQPGQTYDGMAVNLAGSGYYSSTLAEFEWTTSGSVGGQSWSGSGAMQWVGDPTATPCFNMNLGGVNYKVCANLEVDGTGDSTGTYTFTDGAGHTYGPYNGTDHLTTGGWFHSITVPRNPVTPNGQIDVIASVGTLNGIIQQPGGGFQGGGIGNFSVQTSAVPEPSAFAMFAIGFGAIAGSRSLARYFKQR